MTDDILIYDGNDQLTQERYDIQKRRLFLLEEWATQVNAKKTRKCETCCWYREKFQDPSARDRLGDVINLPQGTCHGDMPDAQVPLAGNRWPMVKATEVCRHWSQDEDTPPMTEERIVPVKDERPRRAIEL